jgi:signal transduction histidine kinase
VTVAALQTLADQAALSVSLDRAGEPRSLPEVVDRGAYRVVRDALAAVVDASAASIAIEYVPGALIVQVTDDGEPGRCLEDTADFAAAIGGGLTAAAAPGGFRVRAWLPTEDQPPPAAPRAAR